MYLELVPARLSSDKSQPGEAPFLTCNLFDLNGANEG